MSFISANPFRVDEVILPQVCHQNKLIMRAQEKALQQLGKGDLIDNLPTKGGENERSLLSHSLPFRGNRGLCKTRNHVVVVVNQGQTDHCT